MAKKSYLMGMLVVIAAFGFVLSGCASSVTQLSSLDFYDNEVIKLKPYTLLSDTLVRVELSEATSSTATFGKKLDTSTKTDHDRILEKIRETYPSADEILISSFESVAKQQANSTSGKSPISYTYVANVYPIKYQ